MFKIVSYTLMLLTMSCVLQAQSLNDLFESGYFAYNADIDSIVTTKYIINEYADDAPDLNYKHEGKTIALHYFERTVLDATVPKNYKIETIHRFTGLKESMEIKFNDAGNPTSMKYEKPNGEQFNEEITFNYNDANELTVKTKQFYNIMTFDPENKKMETETTFIDESLRAEIAKKDPNAEYDKKGNKVMANTRIGKVSYEYDERNNLVKEVVVSPYGGGFEQLTLHKVY